MLAGGGRGATMQQRNFALELESNVKKVTESYRNLLNGAKVYEDPTSEVEGVQLIAQAGTLVAGVEALQTMVSELKLSMLLSCGNSVELVANVDTERETHRRRGASARAKRLLLQAHIAEAARVLEQLHDRPIPGG